MKLAFGYLRWTPETFWQSTLTELLVAVDGLNETKTGKAKVKPPTDDEMAKLLAKYG